MWEGGGIGLRTWAWHRDLALSPGAHYLAVLGQVVPSLVSVCASTQWFGGTIVRTSGDNAGKALSPVPGTWSGCCDEDAEGAQASCTSTYFTEKLPTLVFNC